MSNNSIRWGIIGCGAVAEKKSGPAFNKVPQSSLVAVMRRNETKAAEYAQRHGVAKWYSNAQELINDDEVNAIYIATPPDSHEAYATMALEAGKAVYVEKPMTLNTEGAEKLAALAALHQDRLVVAHYRRKWPLFEKVKAILEEGAIGTPLLAGLQYFRKPLTTEELEQPGVQWRLDPAISGGGLFHDLAPHQLDLLRYWFGEAVWVEGKSGNLLGANKTADSITGSIVYEGGFQFSGQWCFSAPEGMQRDSIEIMGSKGSISCSVFWGNQVVLQNEKGRQVFSFELPENNQIYLIDQTVQFFLGKAPNPCSATEGLAIIKIMDGFSTLVQTNSNKPW